MTVGIYELVDPSTGERLYLGQSVDLDKRIATHLGKLRRGTHSISELQEYVTRRGLPKARTVVVCSREELNKLEVHHFDVLEPKFWQQRPQLTYRYTGDPGENKLDKKCAICGETFAAQQSRAKYCSDECYYEGRKRKHDCVQCGKTFYTFSTRSDWCSTQCRLDSKKRTSSCLGCGATFTSNGAKYCSKECAPKPQYDQICTVCGSHFVSVRAKASFCSHKCRHERTFTCVCKRCDIEFKARHANAKLCSVTCGSQNKSRC